MIAVAADPEATKHAETLARWLRAAPTPPPTPEPPSVVEWAEQNFWIPSDNGRPRLIRLMPHQKVILRLFFDSAPAEAFGCGPNFQTLVYSTVKKSGKGLSTDTLLPTPGGWTTMGEVKLGDTLLDSQGLPTRITYASPIRYDLPCYRVTFSDGSSVVTDNEHRWVVESLPRYHPHVLTTPQIKESLWRKDGACNHRVRNAPPLTLPEAHLPVHPYLLGVWLGDGNSSDGTITVGEEDFEAELLQVILAGADTELVNSYNDLKAIQYRIKGLTPALRQLNLIGNKHIPPIYLRASYSQRAALLEGLMDTDGYINVEKHGEYEISQKNERLALEIMELLRTLGVSPTLRDHAATIYGRYVGRRYRVFFHAPRFEVFRLPRKLALQKADEVYRGARTDRAYSRRITSITEHPSVPTKCVQVDSSDSTYLCGRTMVPTHNTAVAAMVARWIAETWGSHTEVYCMANDLEQARGRIYQAAITSIEEDPRYARADKGIAGMWRIIERQALHIPTRSTIKAVSADYKGEAGSNPVASLWSELWGFSSEAGQRLWEELTPVPTRPRSIRYVETYAGYEGESSILNDLEDRVKKEGRRLTRDELIPLGLSWPFPPSQPLPFFVHTPSRTFAYWDEGEDARRMPWQTPQYYIAQQSDLRPTAYERLHLNKRVSATDEFIQAEWWDRLVTPEASKPPSRNEPLIIGADAGVTGDCTGLVAVSRDPKAPDNVLQRLSRVWYPPPGKALDYSLTIEPTLRQWCTGHIHPLSEQCDTHSKVDVLGKCVPTQPYNVVQVAYDQYQLHDLMTRLRNEAVTWCHPFSQMGDRMTADKALFDMIRDQRIHHTGDDDLREHVLNAGAKVPADDNTRLRLVKKSNKAKIDLAVCLSMAAHECLRLNL